MLEKRIMKALLEDRLMLFALTILVVGGLASFVIWRLFLCPEGLASKQEQKADLFPRSLSEANETLSPDQELEEGEEDSLEEQKLAQAQQIGSSAPNFVLEDLEGNKVSLFEFRGRNVLLIYWDSTCGWCEKERLDLIRFTQEQKGKIEVLAFSREQKEELKKYVKEKEINFAILLDPEGKTQADYLAIGTPNHFLINKQSKIAATRPGYASYDDLLELAQTLEE